MAEPLLQSGSLAEFTALSRGNVDAGRFLYQMVYVLHLWDDFVDGDNPRSRADIQKGFWFALVEIPSNPFYQANYEALNSDLQTAILNWQAANRLEEDRRAGDLSIAFICRSEYVNLLLKVALLCGGAEYAAAVAPEVRRFAHAEGFGEYQAGLGKEQRTD